MTENPQDRYLTAIEEARDKREDEVRLRKIKLASARAHLYSVYVLMALFAALILKELFNA
jgi:hypothetical protein